MGERTTKGPELARDTSEKVELIRKRLLTAQSQQTSYVDKRRRPLEFEVGDHVFLKVMPKRGVARFGKRGKLSPRYIGPFECSCGIPCLYAPEAHSRFYSCGGLWRACC